MIRQGRDTLFNFSIRNQLKQALILSTSYQLLAQPTWNPSIALLIYFSCIKTAKLSYITIYLQEKDYTKKVYFLKTCTRCQTRDALKIHPRSDKLLCCAAYSQIKTCYQNPTHVPAKADINLIYKKVTKIRPKPELTSISDLLKVATAEVIYDLTSTTWQLSNLFQS